jgi:hypothetical protein
MSIQETVQKIKIFLQFPPTDLLIVAIIVLVGFAGFGLGRLSKTDDARAPVTITSIGEVGSPETGNTEEVTSTSVASSGEVVASKNGTKYHFPWCAGAQQIADKNRISFASPEEARASGYSPAANCKGLE